MDDLAKQLYDQLNDLFPELQTLTTVSDHEYKRLEYTSTRIIILAADAQKIHLLLTRHKMANGKMIAVSMEVLIDRAAQTAHAIGYKDAHYFYGVVQNHPEVGEMTMHEANRRLHALLGESKNRPGNSKMVAAR